MDKILLLKPAIFIVICIWFLVSCGHKDKVIHEISEEKYMNVTSPNGAVYTKGILNIMLSDKVTNPNETIHEIANSLSGTSRSKSNSIIYELSIPAANTYADLESIADDLRKDPRVLTVSLLQKGKLH